MLEIASIIENYPKVSEILRREKEDWIRKTQEEVRELQSYAKNKKLKTILHFYEPSYPPQFSEHYPEILGLYQKGKSPLMQSFCPASEKALKLEAEKFSEMIQTFPDMALE